MDAWELILTCDHVTTFIQHRENTYVRGVVDCPECQTRRGVVGSRRLGPAYTDEGVKAVQSEAEQARLAAELIKAKEQLRRQQQRAAVTSNRIEELQKQLSPSAQGATALRERCVSGLGGTGWIRRHPGSGMEVSDLWKRDLVALLSTA